MDNSRRRMGLGRAIVAAGLVLAVGLGVIAADDYQLGPDSLVKEGVPKGKLIEGKHVGAEGGVWPGAERDYWVYVPAQYDGGEPAALMVFADGQGYASENGHSRVPVVFDNLIAEGSMPVTIGVFVNPGVFPPAAEGQRGRRNRSVEYDTLSDAYVRFIDDELLPAIEKEHGLKISKDAAMRGAAGLSSGGICAFSMAWERPESYSKVVSYIGSFTNIRGGDAYPFLVRKTAGSPKPIRVFLQDGEGDLDNEHGSWPLGNKQMANSLKFAGYDYQFVMGDGAHTPRHGASVLPDALRWLWRDWKGRP